MNYDNAKLRQMLAAEYALGTLRGRARRRLEKIADADSALRSEITFWEGHLGQLGGALAPVAPPAAVWLGIQHRLQFNTPKVAPLRKPAADTAPKAVPFWRIAAGLATAAAVVVAVIVGQRLSSPERANAPQVAQTPPAPQPAPAPTYVALLKLPDASLQWTMSLAPAQNRVKVAASGEYAKLGAHSLELWAITDAGPVPVGLLPLHGTAELKLPANLGGGETVTLAISLEPVGGSTTGKPTGPVLTSGAAVKAV